MKKECSEGTFIFGSYYSAKELNEIKNNPQFNRTLIKAILDFREANENFKQDLFNTKLFKLINKVSEKITRSIR